MEVEKEKRSGETWAKIVGDEKTDRNAEKDDANDGTIGKKRICDYSDFIVSTIVCEYNGRTYFAKSDWRVWVDKKSRKR